MATPALRSDTQLDASAPRRMNGPAVKHLRIPLGRRLDPRLAKHLVSPGVKRIPRDGGKGGFFPGMGEELDVTEVQVGYEDPSELAGASPARSIKGHAAAKIRKHAPVRHDGFFPGMGAFDVGSMLTGKNLAIAGAAAAVGYFLLFKRR